MQRLHISKDEVVFIGGDIFKGGNNYVAIEMGIEYTQVKDPEETKDWIRKHFNSNQELSQNKTA